MMTMHQLCLCHHRGVSGYVGTLGSLAVEAHTEHRVQVRGDSGPTVPPPPDPIPAIWQVSMGFRLLPRILRLRFVMILGRLPGCAFYESITCLFTYENDACLLLGNSTVLAAIFFGTIYPIVFRV